MAALNQIAKDFGFDQVIGNIEASKQRLKLAIADYAMEGNNLLVDYFSQITKNLLTTWLHLLRMHQIVLTLSPSQSEDFAA